MYNQMYKFTLFFAPKWQNEMYTKHRNNNSKS